MATNYTFSPAAESDLPAVFALIDARIRWMQSQGIHLWDTYREAYPDDYYLAAIAVGRLFTAKLAGRVVAAATLFDHDARWTDGASALYVHNLVSAPDVPGAGQAILAFCEAQAQARNCDFLRLDCSRFNPRLNAYYDALGFAFVASLPGDEYYVPNLREKKLRD